MQERILSWQGYQSGSGEKNTSWYVAVGIIAVGVAVASVIAHNILLAVLAIFSALAVMLAGSQPSTKQHYALSERGIHIGSTVIPFSNMSRFALHEHEPMELVLETTSLLGTVSLPLEGVDFRTVRSELKNRNIEEADSLSSFGETIARMIGM